MKITPQDLHGYFTTEETVAQIQFGFHVTSDRKPLIAFSQNIAVYLIYNVVLVSGMKQNDSYIYILFSKLLQGIEYSSLCYIVGPCSLPILYIVACIF